MRIDFAIILAAACVLSQPALSQTQQDPDLNIVPPAEDCRVVPEEQKAEGDDDGQDGAQGSLSGKLDKCGSVLAPPPVGDAGIVDPPPDVGRTPVIPPSDLPEQQSPG